MISWTNPPIKYVSETVSNSVIKDLLKFILQKDKIWPLKQN